jgi:coproporphyrinogen III oxidase
MLELDGEQQAARGWFESLRDRICAEFEAIEREAGSDAAFGYTPWERIDADGAPAAAACAG